jgi:hypothetical protein
MCASHHHDRPPLSSQPFPRVARATSKDQDQRCPSVPKDEKSSSGDCSDSVFSNKQKVVRCKGGARLREELSKAA